MAPSDPLEGSLQRPAQETGGRHARTLPRYASENQGPGELDEQELCPGPRWESAGVRSLGVARARWAGPK